MNELFCVFVCVHACMRLFMNVYWFSNDFKDKELANNECVFVCVGALVNIYESMFVRMHACMYLCESTCVFVLRKSFVHWE